MKDKNFESMDERQKLKNLKRELDSGVISFEEKTEDTSLALNPVRYLMPLESKPNKKEKLDIDYKKKDQPSDKNFEIIIEVNPKGYEENKKRRRESKLPAPHKSYPLERVKRDQQKINKGSLFYDYLEIYLNRTKNIERQFFEDYFGL
ncbi:hypothetical protein QP518_02215 [Peptoniphilus harei]|nr:MULTISPECIES: hypothetical protein [Peptoniphilus]MDK7354563.1 hypothetical protein [Peptoniphilus harei]MDK7369808.1 hypothetical protein [Peptoniphilus harei]MDK7377915.1 hypothetical protein [Peptoniphilus harei]MDK7680225.1 hypothetical protein [Peptoniphilus harei]MDU2504020.1 hypothetical protein [Peptoniphilus harei]